MKNNLILKTPSVAIFMDFCADPFWNYSDGFTSENLWSEDFYSEISKDLQDKFEKYRSDWEKVADKNFYEKQDFFEINFNNEVKMLATELKKEIPELNVYYVEYFLINNELEHEFKKV